MGSCSFASGSGAGRRLRVGALVAIALLALGTPGCGLWDDDGGGGGSFDELLVVSDGWTVRTFSVSPTGNSIEVLDAETIPGIPGTYSRSGTTVTVTMQKHNVPTGYKLLLDFGPGVGGTATDGVYVVTNVDEDTFTVEDTESGTITGGTLLRGPAVSLGATYAQAATTVTVNLVAHGLSAGDIVTLDYTTGAAVDDDTLITSVPTPDTFTVTADAPLVTSGDVTVTVGGNYAIFGAAMHPSGEWLYVTSTFDCFNGDPYCWGGDLITQFAIDWDSGELTFVESYRTSDDTSAVTSQPSPVTLVFSDDGLHLFHQDDDLDGLRMWDVDPADGSISLAAASTPSSTGQHGIAVHPDGSRVYHGSRVFTVGPASLTQIPGGSAGEANQILGSTMFALIGGGDNAQLRTYSLANPDLPAQLAASANTPHSARDFALLDGGSLIVTSGFGGLKSYTWDGVGTIAPAVGAGDTELRDGGLPFPPRSDPVVRSYRTVSANAAETLVASAYFTHDENAGTGGVPPSGVVLVSVAPDGSLDLRLDASFARYARVARFFQRP